MLNQKDSLKGKVLQAARKLFMEHGYEAVGMRDIAGAVGKQPLQLYRLNLSKADILAEVIIALNQEQITQLPDLRRRVQGESLHERCCAYLRELYSMDIHNLPIRSVGAAFGWTWNSRYEQQIVAQVMQLLQPVIDWMKAAGLDGIEARAYGIWSVYYVGFRRAVLHGGNAEECCGEISPVLEILLGQQSK